ncbi:FHA domain-containing protein [Actinosynnema sp. NPDC053489]|uniref:FHA domain-containing protein n=1 Tax=Actinosynnema sp. NPDC053489 TaxID=3363916 RepID=UPI0037C79149
MITYRPGGVVAVVGGGTWLLLDADPAAELVGRCWELVSAGAGLDEVLSAIVHEGFRAVGNFALARWAGQERRVVLRGAARVEVGGPDGAVRELVAEGVATWLDRGLEADRTWLRLASGGGAGRPELPVERGVVLAEEVVVRLAADATASTTTADAPVVPDREAALGEPAPQPVAPRSSAEPVDLADFKHDHVFSPSGGQRPVQPPEAARVEPEPEPEPRPEAEPPPAPVPVRLDSDGVIESFGWVRPPVEETMLRHRGTPDQTHHVSTLGAPRVRAVACPNQHLNSEYAVSCRVCAHDIAPQEAFVVPRPPLGVLRLSTGGLVTLDRGVVLGRDPQAGPRGSHAIRLAVRGNDISRNHVEVRLDGWDVHVVDLGSKNGTSVITPGWPAQELAALIPHPLPPGSRVVLGENTFFTYEVTA